MENNVHEKGVNIAELKITTIKLNFMMMKSNLMYVLYNLI